MNQEKYYALVLQGYEGTLNDMEAAFYKDNGGVGGSLPDLRNSWLASKGFTSISIQDSAYKYFGSLGYTGSLQDRETDFWINLDIPTLEDVQALFTGETGGLWDFTRPETLFSDSGRTTLAGIDDPVRGVLDLSGNNRNLQTINSNIRRRVGDYLDFPGTGQGLSVVENFGSSSGFTLIGAWRATNHTGDARAVIGCDYSSSGRVSQGIVLLANPEGAAHTLWFNAAGSVADSIFEASGRDPGIDRTTSVITSGAEGSIIYVDGEEVGSKSTSSSLSPKSTVISIGADSAGTNTPDKRPWLGRIYCVMAISKVLSPSERSLVETYFKQRML